MSRKGITVSNQRINLPEWAVFSTRLDIAAREIFAGLEEPRAAARQILPFLAPLAKRLNPGIGGRG